MAKYTSGEGSKRLPKVKPGLWGLAVTNAVEKSSKQGNPLVELKMEVVQDKNGDTFDEGTGPTFYENLVFVENAAWKIDQFRAAIGEEVVAGEEVEVDPDDLIGCALWAELGIEEYNGKERNCVKAFVVRGEGDDEGPDF